MRPATGDVTTSSPDELEIIEDGAVVVDAEGVIVEAVES